MGHSQTGNKIDFLRSTSQSQKFLLGPYRLISFFLQIFRIINCKILFCDQQPRVNIFQKLVFAIAACQLVTRDENQLPTSVCHVVYQTEEVSQSTQFPTSKYLKLPRVVRLQSGRKDTQIYGVMDIVAVTFTSQISLPRNRIFDSKIKKKKQESFRKKFEKFFKNLSFEKNTFKPEFGKMPAANTDKSIIFDIRYRLQHSPNIRRHTFRR